MTGVSVQYSAFGAMAVTVDGVQLATHPASRARRPLRAAGRPRRAGGRRAAGRRGLGRRGTGPDAGLAPGRGLAAAHASSSPDRTARKGSRLVSTAAGYSLVAEAADVDTWSVRVARPSRRWRPTTAAERLRAARRGPRAVDGGAVRRLRRPRACSARPAGSRSCCSRVEEHAGPGAARPGSPRRGASARWPSSRRSIPYRERMWSLLALAQYQCVAPGRRAGDPAPAARAARRRARRRPVGGDPAARAGGAAAGPVADERTDPAMRPGTAATARAPLRHAAAASRDRGPRAGARRGGSACSTRPARRARRGSCWSRASPASASRGWSSDLGDAAAARWDPGAGRALPRGRLRPGAVALAGHRPHAGRSAEGTATADPLLDAAARTGEVADPVRGRHRPADVRRRRRADRAGRRATPPLLLVLEDIHWADALVAAAAPPPRRPRAADAPVAVVCTRRTTEAHDRATALVDTMAALARAGAERVRLDGLDAASVGALLTASVGEHDPRLDAFVGRGHRRQPVLRAAVRPPARRRSRPRARRPHRRCPCPTASVTCCGNASSGCPTRRSRPLTSAAVLGQPHRPRRGRRARRRTRSTTASTCSTSR